MSKFKIEIYNKDTQDKKILFEDATSLLLATKNVLDKYENYIIIYAYKL